MPHRLARTLALWLGLGALIVAAAPAADWTQYRGPERDGHAAGETLLASWADSGPEELWRVTIGDDGYSSMAVVDGRVFTLVGANGRELAVAHDAATGKRLWEREIDRHRPDGQGGGPRATPTVDGDTVYVIGARSKLFALDAATGLPRWHLDLVEEYGAEIPQWGTSTSPLVLGDLVLLDLGGGRGESVAAFDKRRGELAWSAENDKPGYSSPLEVTIAGVPQVLFFTGTGLVSVSPVDGKRYWRHPWRTSYDVNAAMPVFIPPNRVFISTAYDVGATLLEVERSGEGFTVEEVWRDRQMRNHFNSSVLVGQHLYGFDNATLKCIDVATGQELWAHRGLGKGSLIYADGHLVVFGEQGQLLLVQATPEAFRELGQARPFSGRTWAQPALANGVLYVRSQSELAALRVGR